MKKLYTGFTVIIFSFILFSSAFPQSAPPKELNKREADLVELNKLDKTIKLDIRYARSDNFVGRPVYTEARAFLQRPAAESLLKVHQKLKKQGLGLAIFDGYRPWSVTKLFWEVTPEDKRKFVANPKNGSRHNRGCAVDLSVYDLKTRKLLPMPSDFDDFSDKASPNYKGGTAEETRNRDMLRKLMEAEGFTVNENEWWHFDYKDWREYGIYDIAFSDIREFPDKEVRVRRIEFTGNNFTRDRDIRFRIPLRSGDIFTLENLQKSIEELNTLGKFEKISDQNVSWIWDKPNGEIDFVFYLTEKKQPETISNAKIKEDKNLKKFFDEASVTGGIYIYDRYKNEFTIYDRKRFDSQFVPASTSKIIHSLIFLDSGALKDENEVLKWDGVKRSVDAWNQDQTLRSALKVSAVWFYIETSKRLTQNKMQHYYDAANYGNANTNGFGVDYWNKGDLRITPRQQIDFLVRFYNYNLPFSTHSIDTVKDILIEEKTDKYTLRAKTGWSDAYTPQVGWWVGYVQRSDGNTYFFATEIDIKKDEDAGKRKEITRNILKQLKIID